MGFAPCIHMQFCLVSVCLTHFSLIILFFMYDACICSVHEHSSLDLHAFTDAHNPILIIFPWLVNEILNDWPLLLSCWYWEETKSHFHYHHGGNKICSLSRFNFGRSVDKKEINTIVTFYFNILSKNVYIFFSKLYTISTQKNSIRSNWSCD